MRGVGANALWLSEGDQGITAATARSQRTRRDLWGGARSALSFRSADEASAARLRDVAAPSAPSVVFVVMNRRRSGHAAGIGADTPSSVSRREPPSPPRGEG